MFGRGNWAVFGIEPQSLDSFIRGISSQDSFRFSQLAASIASKFRDEASVGINPFSSPRLDEELTGVDNIKDLRDFLEEYPEGGYPPDSLIIERNLDFIGDEVSFSLGNNKYGFWFVSNAPKDPSDPASKKEALAYSDMERPFKFLVKEEKKLVEERVTATAILNRSQFPVLVDFQHGRVYAASTKPEDVLAVQELLTKMGAKIYSLVWNFGYTSWPGEFLNRIVKETRFKEEMKTRADELSRHHPNEVEKLEDKAMEKVVSNFFAITKLDSEIWVALSTPSSVRIHKPIDPVGVSNPSVAFSLLNMSNDAEVAAAAVVFQEVVIRDTKNGEKLYRNDLFTLTINDNINLLDAGSALLRGFDLPQFKKEVKTTIKAKGSISIRDFWSMWLQAMHDSVVSFVDNMTDVLELDKSGAFGLVQPDHSVDEITEDED